MCARPRCKKQMLPLPLGCGTGVPWCAVAMWRPSSVRIVRIPLKWRSCTWRVAFGDLRVVSETGGGRCCLRIQPSSQLASGVDRPPVPTSRRRFEQTGRRTFLMEHIVGVVSYSAANGAGDAITFPKGNRGLRPVSGWCVRRMRSGHWRGRAGEQDGN